jgi:tetratricopeptide (TPR) repeat protein
VAQRPPASPAARLLLVFLALAALLMATLLSPRAAALAAGDSEYRQGVAAAKAGQYTAAAHDFEQAILKGHNDPDTFYQLGLAYEALKRWNDAAWAVATALSDTVFNATHPEATATLDAVQRAGGADSGPPPLLANVTVRPMQPTPELQGMMEARSALSALQGNGAYFVAPVFDKAVTADTAGALTSAAADLQNNSDTVAKFAFLSGVPTPYTSLAAYARDLFTHLGLQRGVVVVMTPKSVAAYSDRLDVKATARIVQAHQATSPQDPADRAAQIARAVIRQADDNDTAATQRNLIVGGAIVAIILAAVAFAIRRIAQPPAAHGRGPSRRTGVAARPRAR